MELLLLPIKKVLILFLCIPCGFQYRLLSVNVMTQDIVSVTVTHNPELNFLRRQLSLLSGQGVLTIVVDNNSNIDVGSWGHGLLMFADHVIPLSENMGIAYAHNVGINFARQRCAKYVLLMDQDSLPHTDMVSKLIDCTEKYCLAGEKVAAVGPRYFDSRQKNPPPFLSIRGFRLHRFTCEEHISSVPVDYLISSGSLISIRTLDAVGGMRDDLFIDYVDIEWGLRAQYHGYQSYGVCDARMEHSLGDNPIRFFGRHIPIHSPLRHYYQFRNAVLLYRCRWLPLNWKIVDGFRLVLRYGFYTLFARPRFEHWRMMTLGMLHGLFNRSGKY